MAASSPWHFEMTTAMRDRLGLPWLAGAISICIELGFLAFLGRIGQPGIRMVRTANRLGWDQSNRVFLFI